MTHYYNENNLYAAEVLRHLIDVGELPSGVIDTRDIALVGGQDLAGFTHCHFFAGVGGWALAAKIARWPEDRQLWTGSCPCQPFSTNGKRKGAEDERHLWPEFARLIAECRPSTVVGEQVASADGRSWLDAGVRPNLEALAYAVWASDLCAAGVGSPQVRQRLWWAGLRDWTPDAIDRGDEQASAQRYLRNMENGPWSDVEWIETGDGRKFRNRPGLSFLADGIPFRVGAMRCAGNAIVPQVGAEVLGMLMEL